MLQSLRHRYNHDFSEKQYQKMLNYVANAWSHPANFRIAETPVFVPERLKKQLYEACEEISDTICRPDFKRLSQSALLPENFVPGETDHTTFLQMDFGICQDETGHLSPQLIEVQGFPSVYFFQNLVALAYRQFFDIPDNFSHLFHGFDPEQYIELLRKIIIGDSDPKNVILLEVEPDKQMTNIDFAGARHQLGVPTVCISDLHTAGRQVYYHDASGSKVGVEKIFNRVIFDELIRRDDLKRSFYFTNEYDLQWIGHPHWFFRISKHTLPLLNSRFVPKSYFLHELEEIPADLQNYVLKPLYSFAGTGVIINLNRYDIEAIEDRENYILQRKVSYAPVIETPTGPAKCEIRMLMLWERGAARPRMVNNLARLSKGEMVGVRYNKDKDWVGGSVGFFENE